jgi:hypothetical protein
MKDRRTRADVTAAQILLAATLAASGCVIRGDGHRWAYAVNGGIAASGALIIAEANRRECPGFDFGLCELDRMAEATVGAGIIAVALAGAVITASLNRGGEAQLGPAEQISPAASPEPAVVFFDPTCAPYRRAILEAETPEEQRAAARAAPPECH